MERGVSAPPPSFELQTCLPLKHVETPNREVGGDGLCEQYFVSRGDDGPERSCREFYFGTTSANYYARNADDPAR